MEKKTGRREKIKIAATAADSSPQGDTITQGFTALSVSKPIPLASVLRQKSKMRRETSLHFAVDLGKALFNFDDAPKCRSMWEAVGRVPGCVP